MFEPEVGFRVKQFRELCLGGGGSFLFGSRGLHCVALSFFSGVPELRRVQGSTPRPGNVVPGFGQKAPSKRIPPHPFNQNGTTLQV